MQRLKELLSLTMPGFGKAIFRHAKFLSVASFDNAHFYINIDFSNAQFAALRHLKAPVSYTSRGKRSCRQDG